MKPDLGNGAGRGEGRGEGQGLRQHSPFRIAKKKVKNPLSINSNLTARRRSPTCHEVDVDVVLVPRVVHHGDLRLHHQRAAHGFLHLLLLRRR